MKHRSGNLTFILLVVLTGAVWGIFPPADNGIENYERYFIGMLLGSLVIVLMSFSLFLSTRPRWAEPYFGGLDKMYMTHRRTSTAAFLLMFLHFLMIPISVTDLGVGNLLAILAFLGILGIVLPTLAPRIPFLGKLGGENYESWKKLHRYIGLFFIAGYLHSITVHAPPASIAINWNQLFVFLGIGSYFYTEILGRFLRKYVPYRVEAVHHPGPSLSEVVLRAAKAPIAAYRAGQFLFVRFLASGLNEAHPFTISSAPHEDVLRVTVKASGDFTRRLFTDLQSGTEAVVEGPYGMFDYKQGGSRQIWIAGGIGVTPFLSFLRDMKGSLPFDVDLYYAVRHADEAVFLKEMEAAAESHAGLRLHLHVSSKAGSLTVKDMVRNAGGDIREHHVYMCGPLPMLQAFKESFRAAGLPDSSLHFEEFNFR